MTINREQDHIFLEYTQALCSRCMKQIPGKIILKGKQVLLSKTCSEHGHQETLLEEHAEFYLNRNHYLKAGTKSAIQTPVDKGCPYDCGICPEHHQHTCVGLIEVTKNCNMACPVCYANGGDNKQTFLSMSKIEEMMDFFQTSENNQAEILQLSGGEPTLHPQILDIIQMAKDKKFSYVMLNTNGKRIAEDKHFAEALSHFKGNFEVYLQFDGLKPSTYEVLRGDVNILAMKKEALKHIEEYKIPTTLVATIYEGINDDEIADIVTYAIESSFVRGVNFQPVAFFGRTPQHEERLNKRITLTGILNRLNKQSGGMFTTDDFISLPCNVDKIAVSYFYRSKKGFVSVTNNANIKSYLPLLNNTLDFKVEDFIDNANFKIGMCDCMDFIIDLKKIIPKGFMLKSKEEKMKFVDENTFRITVSSFIDKYNFDIKAQQRECVHIITEDLKKIPFSTYNMIYRDLEEQHNAI